MMENGKEFLLKVGDEIIASSEKSGWIEEIEKESEQWTASMAPQWESQWEYYMRRKNRYYFRSNTGTKIMAELSKIPEGMPKHYGPVEIYISYQ